MVFDQFFYYLHCIANGLHNGVILSAIMIETFPQQCNFAVQYVVLKLMH